MIFQQMVLLLYGEPQSMLYIAENAQYCWLLKKKLKIHVQQSQ